jgi:hypothetical protein
MGLDNYWQPPMANMNRKRPEMTGLSVWGGMMSSVEHGGFRGKVYAPILLERSGVDIYEELDNDACFAVWERIKDVAWTDLTEGQQEVLGEQPYWDDFKKMWQTYTEAGFRLHAWY